MKNVFYFTLKARFILKIFKFFPDFLAMINYNLISKFMSWTGKQLQYTYCPVSQEV